MNVAPLTVHQKDVNSEPSASRKIRYGPTIHDFLAPSLNFSSIGRFDRSTIRRVHSIHVSFKQPPAYDSSCAYVE